MNAHFHPSPRTRFMLRRGVMPWGMFAGVAAAIAVMITARSESDVGSPLGAIVLAGICFAVWTALIGWAVGLFLWSTRPLEGDTGADRQRTRESNKRES